MKILDIIVICKVCLAISLLWLIIFNPAYHKDFKEVKIYLDLHLITSLKICYWKLCMIKWKIKKISFLELRLKISNLLHIKQMGKVSILSLIRIIILLYRQRILYFARERVLLFDQDYLHLCLQSICKVNKTWWISSMCTLHQKNLQKLWKNKIKMQCFILYMVKKL